MSLSSNSISIGAPGVVSPIIELWKCVRRHRILFMSMVILTTAIAAIFAFSLTPRFAATASVAVVPLTADPLQPGAQEERGLRDDEVSTQAALLTSRDLATVVVEKLGLGAEAPKVPFFLGLLCERLSSIGETTAICSPPQVPSLRTRVTSFLGQLKAAVVPRTRLIELTFTDPNPEAAAAALDTLIKVYQDQQVAQRADALTRTSNWVSERAEQLRQVWLTAETRAGAFRSGSGMTLTKTQSGLESLVSKQISDASASLSNAQTEFATATARQTAMRSAARSPDRLALISMQNEPSIVALTTQLAPLRAQRADLLSRLTPSNPMLVPVDKQIASIEAQLNAEVARALRAIDVDVSVKRSAVDDMQRRLLDLRQQADHQTSGEVQLATLDDQAKSAKAVFETFLSRAKALDDRVSLLQSQVQFASHADVGDHPTFPHKSRFLLGGLAFGVLCGLGGAMLREHLSSAFVNISRVSQQLSLPLLCTIPRLSRWTSVRRIARGVSRNPLAAESMRSLLAQVQLAQGPGVPLRSVVIASATGREGKTMTALWLAEAAARSGQKVLLVDGDHRRGTVNRLLRGTKGLGFTDLLFRDANFEEVIQVSQGGHFSFIAAGVSTSRSFGRQDLDRLRTILIKLESAYDLVIIDTPPLLAVADALIYAHVAAATILLCRWRYTGRRAVQATLARLQAARANVLGVVVSFMDMNRLYDYSDEHERSDVSVMRRYYLGRPDHS